MPAVRGAHAARADRSSAGYDSHDSFDGYDSYDGAADERPAGRGPQALPPLDIARTAMRRVAELTGRQPAGVTSLEPADDGWAVEAEVVEDRRIPSSGDMLGLYRIDLRADGALLSLHRVRRYPRGRADGSEVT